LVAPLGSTGIGTLYRGYQLLLFIWEEAYRQAALYLRGFPICATWRYEDKVSDLQTFLISKLEVLIILEHIYYIKV
jgi:hypothetical protein